LAGNGGDGDARSLVAGGSGAKGWEAETGEAKERTGVDGFSWRMQ